MIRFEINEMMRIIWLDRRKLETHKTTLTAVLAKVEDFRRRLLSAKYDGLLDVREPAQWYAKCVMYLLTYRLHVIVLHPYHLNAGGPPLHTPLTIRPAFQPQTVSPGLSESQGLWNLPLRHGTANGGGPPTCVGPAQPTATTGTAVVGSMGQGNSDSNPKTHNIITDTIDWDTMNSLFPADPQNGGLSVQGFHDLNLGVPD
ncbi:hypothetical protein DL765_004353 [Monosporascus sp. GIB2]|nr:hypothetical protein DL765_004353 [Monosporascus sp. GIB2]